MGRIALSIRVSAQCNQQDAQTTKRTEDAFDARKVTVTLGVPQDQETVRDVLSVLLASD